MLDCKDKKILIVDDNEADRMIIKRFLDKAGYEKILLAKNAEESLKKAETEKPDLVLLDILMPDLDGITTLTKLKNNYKVRSIIMVSALADPTTIHDSGLFGVAEYITKPIHSEELVTKIEQVLEFDSKRNID